MSGVPDRPGAAHINVAAAILGADLPAGRSVAHRIAPGRHTYVLAASGRLTVNGAELGERDGAEVNGEDMLTIEALEDSDVLVLDLP